VEPDRRDELGAGGSGGRGHRRPALRGGRLGGTGDPVPSLEIYDPLSNNWSTGASMPVPLAAGGVAVLNGRMYVVGGCDTKHPRAPRGVRLRSAVEQLDPVADYPLAISWEACGALTGQLYCASGTSDALNDTAKGYAYNPTIDTWSPIIDLPMTMWASGYTAANGMLLVSGGVSRPG